MYHVSALAPAWTTCENLYLVQLLCAFTRGLVRHICAFTIAPRHVKTMRGGSADCCGWNQLTHTHTLVGAIGKVALVFPTAITGCIHHAHQTSIQFAMQSFQFHSSFAEATSCAAAIRQARGVVADIGEEAAKKSPGLPELARCQQSTSERDVRRVVVKYHLSVPIPLTQLRKTPGTMYQGEINVLSLKDWITYIVQNNVWHLLVGLMKADAIRERKILVEFWRRYRQLRPTHPIFEMSDAGKVDLSRCAPCVVHGDEGRGRKKTGFLVISYYSYIGFGTSQANQARKNKEYLRMRLNYGGSSLLHRLLTAVLPKMLKDDALNDILQFIGEDARGMLLEGVKNAQGDTFRVCILQCCGDWQWLIKAGHLVRSYLNVEKRPKKEGANPKGVCHLRAAGQTGVFWERYRGLRQPLWFPTMLSQDPFGSQSGLNRIPFLPNQQPLFYTFDLFHSWHLGVGKSLVAGCLAMASEYMWASNVDDRLEQLSGLFMTWCAENHEWAFLNSLTRPVLGWMDKGQYPNGYWSKGHTTTTLCTFFVSWARHQDFSGDTLMQLSVETCQEMSKALRIMYESDVWLPKHVAGEVAALGLMTMEWHKKIATQAFRENKALFPHMPKGHSIDHIFHQLQMDVESGAEFCLNPLNHSVQISLDYVGRLSRVSRRTSPQQVITRVLQRNLQAVYRQWRDHGFIRE